MSGLLTPGKLRAAMKWAQAHQNLADLMPSKFIGDDAWASEAFIKRVAAFQAAHGLDVDGRAGPKQTIPAIVAAYHQPAGDTEGLVWGTSVLSVEGVQIINFRHPMGMDLGRFPDHLHGRFPAGEPSCIVLHDSITRTAQKCFDVLLERVDEQTGRNLRLGTHLIVSGSGTVYQTADLDTVVRHASGGLNKRAVGIDYANLLDPVFSPHHPLRRLATSWARKGYIDLTPEQKATTKLLLPALAGWLGVPLRWPVRPDGSPDCRGKEEVAPVDLRSYKGVLAHGQASPSRWDGNAALLALTGGS